MDSKTLFSGRRHAGQNISVGVELPHAHQHVEAFELQTFFETDHRRMIGGEHLVVPFHRTDHHVEAQRHDLGKKRAFQGAFDGEPSRRFGGSITVKLLRPTEA